MAFDNTVPYTIDGTIDTNTNLITFVVSEYDLDRATNLYDDLQWTETFAIPASACGYKRNTNQVFIVTNDSQDQFSIYQGWYDVQADVTYSSITVALDNMVDALIAQQTGGGSTILHYQLSEADAKTELSLKTLEAGALYSIELDGTSEGDNTDIINAIALNNEALSTSIQYYHAAEGDFHSVIGEFTSSGFAFRSADPTSETTSAGGYYTFDGATDTLTLDASAVYGSVTIAIAANEDLETITGGFEGMEITIYATGGGAFVLNVLDSGNIIIPVGSISLVDNNIEFVTLRKRGSVWIKIAQLS